MSTERLPGALFGAATTALGAFVIYGARQISSGFSYDAVGPTLFPTLIGIGLLASGVVILIHVRRSGDQGREDKRSLDWLPVGLISAALLGEALLVGKLGWIPVVATVFLAGTFAFGDRRILLNAGIGLGLGTFILFAFSFGLGVDLPLGPLEPLLQSYR